MDEVRTERASIAADMEKLLAALPHIAQLPVEDPAREAWMQWKVALLGQIRLLELRERQLSSEPYLWITDAMVERIQSPS